MTEWEPTMYSTILVHFGEVFDDVSKSQRVGTSKGLRSQCLEWQRWPPVPQGRGSVASGDLSAHQAPLPV